MKKLFFFLFSVTVVLSSCTDYGKKVAINHKSDVYYKGDGVTEKDAKALGDFLLAQGFFNATDERSVQLQKDGEAHVVKIVVNEQKLAQDKENILTSFKVWQMWIQDNVFNGAKTKVILTNAEFKDLQDVGAFTAAEKAELNSAETTDSLVPDASATTDSTGTNIPEQ